MKNATVGDVDHLRIDFWSSHLIKTRYSTVDFISGEFLQLIRHFRDNQVERTDGSHNDVFFSYILFGNCVKKRMKRIYP